MTQSVRFDLSGYPQPDAIEIVDFEKIVDDMSVDFVARYPAGAGFITLESEPARIQIEVQASREALLRQRFNDVVKSNILAYSTGNDLNHLAAFHDVVRMPGEDDERLRVRTILAIQGRSTGGTAPRYRSVAMSSSLRVADAHIYKVGTDPTIHCAVFAADNSGVADATLLATVNAALQAPDVRMVNDTILVRPAVFSIVDVAADVWLLPETPDNALAALEASLRASWLEETNLGFDLTRSWLISRLMRPGVQKIEIMAPNADRTAQPYEAIALGAITLVNRGRAY